MWMHSSARFNPPAGISPDISPGPHPVRRVGDLAARRACLSFPPGRDIRSIVGAMLDSRFGAAVVTAADGTLEGLLTERDILGKLVALPGEDTSVPLESLTARDVMIPGPVCLDADDDPAAALDKMTAHGFRYMPVLEAGRVRGIADIRELYGFVQSSFRSQLEKKDTLLSYLMHHEPYGLGYLPTPA